MQKGLDVSSVLGTQALVERAVEWGFVGEEVDGCYPIFAHFFGIVLALLVRVCEKILGKHQSLGQEDMTGSKVI